MNGLWTRKYDLKLSCLVMDTTEVRSFCESKAALLSQVILSNLVRALKMDQYIPVDYLYREAFRPLMRASAHHGYKTLEVSEE